jgi:hypothetical protein
MGLWRHWPRGEKSGGRPASSSPCREPDKALQEYYCYLLLDFATVDRDLEELPLAAALVLSRPLALADRFKEIVLKETKLTKKRLSQLDGRADELLAEAKCKTQSALQAGGLQEVP